jgi:hypothetical protein
MVARSRFEPFRDCDAVAQLDLQTSIAAMQSGNPLRETVGHRYDVKQASNQQLRSFRTRAHSIVTQAFATSERHRAATSGGTGL